ncbi:MAG: uroporphyrinogen-III synthase [Alphaproteobacteria bacterium]|nr:uroporphyrinogen-III synthase [Alphaproteobacteria bacterium]
MRVLLTRPRHDADALANLIAALGHSTLVEPLIDIQFIAGPELDLSHTDALVLTSANGARAAAQRTSNRTIPIFAVGPATATQAAQAGFQFVSQSGGHGVEGLTSHIRSILDPKASALLHLTGSAVAGDLAGALKAQGFQVRSQKIYEATPAKLLPAALSSALTAGHIDAAMFFSPRTAAIFSDLVSQTGLGPACASVTALALSPSVAKSLATLTFRKVLVAHSASAQSMLKLLETLLPA